MSAETKNVTASKTWLFSLDGWAVLAAFGAALLVRAGVFKHVPW
jgi:hypothetical protein